MSNQLPPIPEVIKTSNDVKEEKEPGFFAEHKKLIVVCLIALLMLLFIFQNLHPVIFTLFFIPMNIPLVILILMFFGIGSISVWVYSYFNKKELKKKIRNLESKLKKYE